MHLLINFLVHSIDNDYEPQLLQALFSGWGINSAQQEFLSARHFPSMTKAGKSKIEVAQGFVLRTREKRQERENEMLGKDFQCLDCTS